MQSTPSPTHPATPHVHFSVPVSDIRAAVAPVPDRRRRQGTRFPLPAILTLAVAAILANHTSLLAIAEWGAAQTDAIKQALGFPKPRTPHVSTLQRLFRRLDPDALAAALTEFFDPQVPGEVPARGSEGVAIDGKAQRGRRRYEPGRTHPVHSISLFSQMGGVVLAQVALDQQAHEGELTVAAEVLEQIDWHGRVLTGDALYCQRRLCAQVVEAGGDYLFLVDANQPTLQADIEQVFAPSPPPAPGHAPISMEEQQAETVDKGHGRLEVREIRVSSELAEYLDWPYLAQVFELTRTWTQKGVRKAEVRLGITSLPQGVADAERLLALKRGHWGIENRLHYVLDETLGEDRSTLHCGHGATIMGMLRWAALSALRRAGVNQIAARLRHNARRPEDALKVLGLVPC
ncbi:MAG: ISAs1 family transposase [Chloroflexota bacterium]|nr:ISAs1 family transposase [Chloroflexota bacterium]